jgi:hypothetical protein
MIFYTPMALTNIAFCRIYEAYQGNIKATYPLQTPLIKNHVRVRIPVPPPFIYAFEAVSKKSI